MSPRVFLTFILFAISEAAPPSERGAVASDVDGEVFFLDSMKSILNDINDLNREVSEEGDYLRETEAVVEAMCHDFRYPVKTRLEFIVSRVTRRNDPVTGRFRRDDKATLTQNYGSSNDYMSSYYAQRKAIMDKYKSQQKEIMERLTKTKSLIAESKKLKESKKRIDSGRTNVTRDQPGDPEAVHANITESSDHHSTTLPSSTSSGVGLTQTTSTPLSGVPELNFSTFNETRDPNLNSSSKSFFNSSDEDLADDYSSEIDSPSTTLSPIWETPVPFDAGEDKTDISEKPDLRGLESDWPNESINFIPQNDVDFNTTEQSLVRQDLGNDTVIFNLGGHSANPSMMNDSALHQLEEMFLWDVPAGDERISRSNETGASARRTEDDFAVGEDSNTIAANDLLGYNSSRSQDSLQFMVNIKGSPEVHVTKNIKNVKTSTTTYRNSTHEIVEINGVVNSTKRIDADSPDVDLTYLKNITSTNPNVTQPASEIGGGARESEWCEDCPHDYRWGDCEGTLFYQHNIFLRNRGPSAIDAIFGMNVQGPVYITCVEAIRYNQTRGIVTLHSGGPGHDFAKLRIRGFQGEGFSYIMKVWGVSNEEFIDGASYSY